MADISIFGLGKVGHTLAACLSSSGNTVIGYDPVSAIIDAIRAGTYSTGEPSVRDRIAAAAGRFSATSDPTEAVLRTSLSIVIVPTPSNMLGGFSLRYVIEACRQIANAMKAKSSRHVIAVASTILPGASRRFIIPAIEEAFGTPMGSAFGYCYNPSFIALGEVVRGFEEPDYVLIGEGDSLSGSIVEDVHRSMIRNDTPVARVTPIEAEIAKIASNTHETMRVAFANMLFSVCSEVPDADVDHVTGALAHRMGQRFFKGAVPYGGPCWPRDNRAFSVFMDAIGVPSLMPRTIDLSNDEHGRYILRKVLAATQRGDTVGLLGLAYKPGTQVIDASFGIALAEWLVSDGRAVVGWDPLATHEAREHLGDTIRYAASAEECLRSVQVAIVINPMKDLAHVDWTAAKGTAVIDPWRCLGLDAVERVGSYLPMGRGNGQNAETWPSAELAERMRLLNS